ncbi:SMI1/KNR4 family protein [Rhodococcus sp. BP-349]|uniref:SMI1/KNR4 family protein n=1 Tax=unclassified Rhodococcus (in: high G+C Gram-positive bacteria) TaxID=192944 RepID=UPI001C9B4768|nr:MULTISPECIES: SMI1/KNR4 family protein [unclassified Rhodococcus (in: high G+C Gram-positive bacteria)]MBY6540319.1 SMI1/KNR4 family protein [Rhodococcus sp. BP-363]MBY6545656.1 SMI1/KNR4 family protein [Rhodococcus sp. BP-369]MBY6564886.1 SMI1/KNR4 family protein [Rhodococcus sp. BP-370]MBY6578178.1 SMI1/KNR4 family protein [Rhodococcus sp. BP-364]MBY6587479.1 SMI1/KNR4 family protein [Rhodococcus sp. BP-358]
MTLSQTWAGYMQLLREVAPVTAASVELPPSREARRQAERETTPWPDELAEFFSLHGGQHFPVGADYWVGTVLPDRALLTLDRLLYRYKLARGTLHDIDDLGPEWPETVRAQEAGETAEMFLDAYVPFAEDGAGDFEYVDTRPGDHHGCVRYFMAEAADGGGPMFDSLTDYIAAVHRSVEAPDEFNGLIPTIVDGALLWEVPERPPGFYDF